MVLHKTKTGALFIRTSYYEVRGGVKKLGKSGQTGGSSGVNVKQKNGNTKNKY